MWPAGQPDPGLNVGRPEHLAVHDAVADVGGETGDGGDGGVGDGLPAVVPVAGRQLVRDVLGEDAHGVPAVGGDRRVVGGVEVQLAPGR